MRDPEVNKIVVKRNLIVNQPYGLRYMGGSKDTPYCTEPKNAMNLQMAFRKRLSPVLPKGDRRLLKRLGSFVKRYLRKHFTPLPHIEPSKIFFMWWLDHCAHYNLARKNKLSRCFDRFMSTGMTLGDSDYRGETFPKREFYPEAKCLRFINSRSDMFKAVLGPYIKMIEDQVYKDKHFVKGTRIDELPRTLKNLSSWDHILETDYSSFESSFSFDYVKVVEMRLFRYFLSNNPFILKLVLATYMSKGKERVQRLYNKDYNINITGCRLSGELWTSLANGFSNLMNMLFLCKEHNIECDGYVEGDDGLFGLSKPGLTKEDFARLGFNIKMEYSHVVQDTTFCGNTFSNENQKLLVNPENIGRLFWTCNATYLRSNEKTLRSLFKSKSASLYVTGRYTPIAGTLAFVMLRRLRNEEMIIDRGFWRREIFNIFHKIPLVAPVISHSDRFLYSMKFGIPISDQILLENYLMDLKTEEVYIPYSFMACNHVSGFRY